MLSDSQKDVIRYSTRELLTAIGESPRPGLADTPYRVAKAWEEWASGYAMNPGTILKTFKDGAERIEDQIILVKNIPFYSMCEHHMAPFFGTASVGYIPDGRIVGLSKIPELVNCFARRLQVQERLTRDIADAFEEHLKPKGVAVFLEARHLCMESRGKRVPGTTTITSAVRGIFMDDTSARAEFLSLCAR